MRRSRRRANPAELVGFGHLPVLVVPKQVDTLDLSLADAAAEAEHLAVAFPHLPPIGKLRGQHVPDHS